MKRLYFRLCLVTGVRYASVSSELLGLYMQYGDMK